MKLNDETGKSDNRIRWLFTPYSVAIVLIAWFLVGRSAEPLPVVRKSKDFVPGKYVCQATDNQGNVGYTVFDFPSFDDDQHVRVQYFSYPGKTFGTMDEMNLWNIFNDDVIQIRYINGLLMFGGANDNKLTPQTSNYYLINSGDGEVSICRDLRGEALLTQSLGPDLMYFEDNDYPLTIYHINSAMGRQIVEGGAPNDL